MGPVERGIRASIQQGASFPTPTGRGRFTDERIDAEGIVLLLGRTEAWTRLSWECLEGVIAFLRGRGWVHIGSVYETRAEPGTFDEYLKRCVKRATAGWVSVVLERAGVAEIDRGQPALIRLVGNERYGS